MVYEMLSCRIAKLLFCPCLLVFASILVFTDDVTSTLIIGGSKIDVTIEAGKLKLSQAELLHWVQSAAEAVARHTMAVIQCLARSFKSFPWTAAAFATVRRSAMAAA